ncbi:MAG: hypothetical protein ACREOJ_10515 [Gemmatimonadaceae bacterium]
MPNVSPRRTIPYDPPSEMTLRNVKWLAERAQAAAALWRRSEHERELREWDRDYAMFGRASVGISPRDYLAGQIHEALGLLFIIAIILLGNF